MIIKRRMTENRIVNAEDFHGIPAVSAMICCMCRILCTGGRVLHCA